MKLNIRWMIRRDMMDVLEIEQRSFQFPWTEEEFVRCLRQRNCIGMIAEADDRLVGYMLYELHKNRLHLLNIAVCGFARRCGLAAAMIDKLVAQLTPQRRSRILLEVRETNLTAQLFFRAKGFKAVSVLRNFHEESDEDAYVMSYRVNKTADAECQGV
jgi:ribosomal-protein-alanine N-acetyltransferase